MPRLTIKIGDQPDRFHTTVTTTDEGMFDDVQRAANTIALNLTSNQDLDAIATSYIEFTVDVLPGDLA